MKYYTLKLSDEMAAIIDRIAEREGNPRASVVRRLVDTGIRKEGLNEEYRPVSQRE